MASVRAGTLFLSSRSVVSPPRRPLISRCKPYSSYTSFASPIKMSAQVVEHIVLFKVRPDTDPTKVSAMVNGLNSLHSLQHLLHLTMGPIHRNRSSSSFTFTHMLHSRHSSKDELDAYGGHPSHVSVVAELVRPICEDVMALDWVAADLSGPVVPPPGSAMRVTFLKLKEGLEDKGKEEILGVVGGIKDSLGSIDQLSVGENFSPARAKGFSIGSIAIFPGLSQLEASDSNVEWVNSQKEKVRDGLDGVVVVDYLIPSPPSAGAASSL